MRFWWRPGRVFRTRTRLAQILREFQVAPNRYSQQDGSYFRHLPNPDVLRPVGHIATLVVAENLERASVVHGVEANLLHKNLHALVTALLDQVSRPINLKRPRAGAALATDNCPLDAVQVKLAEVFDDGF